MACNTINSKDRAQIATRRRNFTLSIAWTWLKTNKPEIAEQIQAMAETKFPRVQNNGRSVGKEILSAVSHIKESK